LSPAELSFHSAETRHPSPHRFTSCLLGFTSAPFHWGLSSYLDPWLALPPVLILLLKEGSRQNYLAAYRLLDKKVGSAK